MDGWRQTSLGGLRAEPASATVRKGGEERLGVTRSSRCRMECHAAAAAPISNTTGPSARPRWGGGWGWNCNPTPLCGHPPRGCNGPRGPRPFRSPLAVDLTASAHPIHVFEGLKTRIAAGGTRYPEPTGHDRHVGTTIPQTKHHRVRNRCEFSHGGLSPEGWLFLNGGRRLATSGILSLTQHRRCLIPLLQAAGFGPRRR